ncbi:MAG TPA: hypothetical protein DCW74_01180 [Alteromonas australica]|uniref:Uncharacterized protein n=1 Tax=Alteromonas australica TaxID=589873 RepID=A0A350NZ64_9ALTE|nr:hypothetical protein [Alteromonas australica]|tara:strand:- start:1151 stop:1465 length:315 start_codon:yes stop_codon:yes gene_type:complete
MAYDFNRAYMDIDSLMAYKAVDREVGQSFGVVVLAVELSNREYQHRFDKLRDTHTMKKPPSSNRIFAGYLVVRNVGQKDQYETWMPEHVFIELYEKISLQKADR